MEKPHQVELVFLFLVHLGGFQHCHGEGVEYLSLIQYLKSIH